MVGVGRVDGVGGAQLAREAKFFITKVNGDDGFRAAEFGAQQPIEANAAQPDHRDGIAGQNACGVDDGADPRHDRAPKDSGFIER